MFKSDDVRRYNMMATRRMKSPRCQPHANPLSPLPLPLQLSKHTQKQKTYNSISCRRNREKLRIRANITKKLLKKKKKTVQDCNFGHNINFFEVLLITTTIVVVSAVFVYSNFLEYQGS